MQQANQRMGASAGVPPHAVLAASLAMLLAGCGGGGNSTPAPTPAPIASVSPSSLTFAAIVAGAKSASQSVTVTNTGNAALAISGISITGADASSFAETSNCGASLAASASCSIAVTFTPQAPSNALAATLSIADNAAGSPQTVALSGQATTPPVQAISIDTSNPADWKISNGAISLDWNSANGNVFGVYLAGRADNLVDTTRNGATTGLYMDNTGLGGGVGAANYALTAGYLDWWVTVPSSATNAFTYSQHFIMTANDPGFHAYFVVDHSAADVAGTAGQIQYVFRINTSLFSNTYSVDSGLGNLGPELVPLPDPSVSGTADPGRQVQNAAVDLHGLALPSGYTREFYTKYDYSSYEYLHRAHGVYGTTYGAWAVLPSRESLVGGPTKQDLIFTDNILIMEAQSSHLDNALAYTPPQGVDSTRIYGPFYFRFNTVGGALATPAELYQDAVGASAGFQALYDSDATLAASGYVPSTGRGSLQAAIAGGGSSTANAAWAVLSDDKTNFQYAANGHQYWANPDASGNADFSGVAPGTYRLTEYVLGQWGELRKDGVAVGANATAAETLAFTPENFGSGPAVFAIGTPDRSAHEFLHGQNAAGQDDREYYGAWNYWKDFAANNGAVVYNATDGASYKATNDLTKWNYTQWGLFNPGLYAGIYNASDDTTDGYKYIVPAYVGDPATARVPPWTVHFTTQQTGSYAVLSVGLAAVEGSVTATLNGKPLVWHVLNASDAAVRSGFAGYYQWVVFQWDASALSPAGQDNVLQLAVSQNQGVMHDALRMEITSKTSDPASTGWHDYEWVYGSAYTPANP